MAVEPARGVRSHLQSAFSSGRHGNDSQVGHVTLELFEQGCDHGAWRHLVFGLCVFNAVAHERRKFNSLGFNLKYNFTASDLQVCFDAFSSSQCNYGLKTG